MIFGRFLVGLGAETTNVSILCWVMKWFKNGNFTLAVSLFGATIRVGMILNSQITPYLSKEYSLQVSLYFGTLVCIVCLISACIARLMDFKYSDTDQQHTAYYNPIDEIKKIHTYPLVTILCFIRAECFIGTPSFFYVWV